MLLDLLRGEEKDGFRAYGNESEVGVGPSCSFSDVLSLKSSSSSEKLRVIGRARPEYCEEEVDLSKFLFIVLQSMSSSKNINLGKLIIKHIFGIYGCKF